jgi:hypothetical protein
VRKWLRRQSKDFYVPGFGALVKRRTSVISVGGGVGVSPSLYLRKGKEQFFLKNGQSDSVTPTHVSSFISMLYLSLAGKFSSHLLYGLLQPASQQTAAPVFLSVASHHDVSTEYSMRIHFRSKPSSNADLDVSSAFDFTREVKCKKLFAERGKFDYTRSARFVAVSLGTCLIPDFVAIGLNIPLIFYLNI